MEKILFNIRKKFEILSLEIRSLSKNIDALSCYLQSNNPNPTVIALNET